MVAVTLLIFWISTKESITFIRMAWIFWLKLNQIFYKKLKVKNKQKKLTLISLLFHHHHKKMIKRNKKLFGIIISAKIYYFKLAMIYQDFKNKKDRNNIAWNLAFHSNSMKKIRESMYILRMLFRIHSAI